MNCDPPGAVEYSPFYGIEKGAVLQEARVFNDSHVDPRRCQQVITKLLYLLTQGESFTKVRYGWGMGGWIHAGKLQLLLKLGSKLLPLLLLL